MGRGYTKELRRALESVAGAKLNGTRNSFGDEFQGFKLEVGRTDRLYMDLTETAIIRIEARQVDRLYSFASLDTITAVLCAALVTAATWFFDAPKPLLALPAIPVVVAIIRWLVSYAYARANPPNSAIRRWGIIFNLGAAAGAAAWGGITAFLLQSDHIAAAVVATGVTAVIAISAVIFYSGALLTTIVVVGVSLTLPMIASVGRGDSLGGLVCAALAITFVISSICARAMKRFVWEFAMCSSENEQLSGSLDKRETQVEKLNVELKTNTDKREQAEITLRRTAADLGLVQGKAKALAETLERVSPNCQVTGLANRRHFNEQLDDEWRRATREQKPMSLVLLEIDEFSEYMEAYSKPSADSLLKRIGQFIKGFGRRSGDLAARYENQKLALMLPGCDARNAMRMTEALRKRVERAKIPHAGAKNRDSLTVHIGVATIKPSRSLANTELLKRADNALYEARFQGGNKIVAYRPLSKLKLARWDRRNDGSLSEQALTQKMLVWGYDTAKHTLEADAPPRAHVSDGETVIAPLTGELVVELEGHSMAVKAGDSIFVPKGISVLLHAGNDAPVIMFSATKSN